MSQSASLRQALMEVLEVRSFRSRLRAMCRIIARFSEVFPLLIRLSSSRKDRSSTQWTRFSMPQWLRAAWSSLLGIRLQTGDVVPGFHRHPVPHPPFRCHHPDALQPRPLPSRIKVGQLLRVVNRPTTAGLNASVALAQGLAEIVFHVFKSGPLPAGKQVFHVLQQPPLVFLDRQDVIGFPAHNPLGYLLLAPHVIDGDDAARHVKGGDKMYHWGGGIVDHLEDEQWLRGRQHEAILAANGESVGLS